MGNGLSIFAPWPGPGSSGAKNRNPGTDPIGDFITRLLLIFTRYLFFFNFDLSCTSHEVDFECWWYPKTTGVSSMVAPPLSQTNYTGIPSKIYHSREGNVIQCFLALRQKISTFSSNKSHKNYIQTNPTKFNSDKGSTLLRQGRFNSNKGRFSPDRQNAELLWAPARFLFGDFLLLHYTKGRRTAAGAGFS